MQFHTAFEASLGYRRPQVQGLNSLVTSSNCRAALNVLDCHMALALFPPHSTAAGRK